MPYLTGPELDLLQLKRIPRNGLMHYRGKRLCGGALPALVVTKGGRVLTPARSQNVRNHSPDGFQWGYSGSGPAQLALALLLDVFNNKKLAQAYYQHFKAFIVCRWGDAWEISQAEILDWAIEECESRIERGEL
jgi:hypothetical protein